jgi:hypothetical protein
VRRLSGACASRVAYVCDKPSNPGQCDSVPVFAAESTLLRFRGTKRFAAPGTRGGIVWLPLSEFECTDFAVAAVRPSCQQPLDLIFDFSNDPRFRLSIAFAVIPQRVSQSSQFAGVCFFWRRPGFTRHMPVCRTKSEVIKDSIARDGIWFLRISGLGQNSLPSITNCVTQLSG